MARRFLGFIFVLVSLFMVACTSGGQTVEPPASQATDTPSPVFGSVVSVSDPVPRPLLQTSEIVPNCGGGSEPVVKHPALGTINLNGVEWEVGGQFGVGVRVGHPTVPIGVDLSAVLEVADRTKLEQSLQQSVTWDLPAAPGEIMTYIIGWEELWQPAYVEVNFGNQDVRRINVNYRTSVRSNIINSSRQNCDGSIAQNAEAATPIIIASPTGNDTGSQTAPPPQAPTSSLTATSFEVYANLSWQDTGVLVNSGDIVRIIWDGLSRWRGVNYGDFSDPLGGYIDPNANYDCQPLMPSEQAGWNALVAKVGDAGAVTNPFKITPTGEGKLYLAMNDCDQQRYDNEGSVIVTIEVRR
jgi:hypothetical protein